MLGKGPASARAVCQCELLPEKSQGVHLSLTGILLGLWGWGRLHAGLPQFTDLEHPELAVLQRTAGDLAEGVWVAWADMELGQSVGARRPTFPSSIVFSVQHRPVLAISEVLLGDKSEQSPQPLFPWRADFLARIGAVGWLGVAPCTSQPLCSPLAFLCGHLP